MLVFTVYVTAELEWGSSTGFIEIGNETKILLKWQSKLV